MDTADTRKCNFFNLEMLARYLGIPVEVLTGYYEELMGDQEFLRAVNRRIAEIGDKWGFRKGIFAMPTIPSVDWICVRAGADLRADPPSQTEPGAGDGGLLRRQ